MNLENLKNKKIAFLGLGIENLALINYLIKQDGEFDISIFDGRDAEKLGERYEGLSQYSFVKWNLADDSKRDLDDFDILFRSAGWPIFDSKIQEVLKKGIEVSSAIKLFFEISPSKNIIGVTGTKGKGTTSGLIVQILKVINKKVFWGGNIGIPVFEFFDQIQEDDFIVLELSSFQLEDIEQSPFISVITNLSSEHLSPADPLNPNYHKSLDDYCEAKLNIFKFQGKDDFAVLSKDFRMFCKSGGRGRLALGRGQKVYFEKSEFESNLFGEYNKENIGAAVEVAKILNIKEAIIKKGIKKFKALPHRMEFVQEVKRVKCYDNSFATTPEATIADLNSFEEDVVLLLGGADKGSDFKELALAVSEKVKFVVLFKGEGSDRILKELKSLGYNQNKIKFVSSMKEAVSLAFEQASSGDAILLSPACASFGIFKNYKERGDLFKREIGV
jgi:UDP-N-acetylmuramoylalanine--D-glutamate ligase